MTEMSQTFHHRIQVSETIGNENDQSAAFEFGDQFVEDFPQISLSSG